MAMLLGKKIGMTQIYDESGKMVTVTVIQAGPCKVLQVKTPDTDGYGALQIGFDDVKKSRIKKPAEGHAKKAGSAPKRFIREWRLATKEEPGHALGDEIGVSEFSEIKFVDVVGTSKGKGYAGVMKRHGFGGFPASHGCERKHRAPGSIGQCQTPGRVFKGKKMAGHLGNVQVTTQNLEVVRVDAERNLLLIKGAVPGPAGGDVYIRPAVKA